MAGKVKTWIWIVVGIAAFCVLALVAVVGGAFFYMSRHIETKSATPAAAAREFEAVRAEFQGRKPLIELDRNGRFLRANTDRPTPKNAPAPDQLRILAFDPTDGRIVQVNVPFWLLRMKAGNATILLTRPSACAGIHITSSVARFPTPRTSWIRSPRTTLSITILRRSTAGPSRVQ